MRSKPVSCKSSAKTTALTPRVGDYTDLPRAAREWQIRNDLILALGAPFLRVLLAAEEIGRAIRESDKSREDKDLALAVAWYGRGESANGLKAATRRLFDVFRLDGSLPRTITRELSYALQTVEAALYGRGAFSRRRTGNNRSQVRES